MDKKSIIAIAISAAIMIIWFGLVNPLIMGGKPFSLSGGGRAADAKAPAAASPAPALPAASALAVSIKAEPPADAKPAASVKPAASAKPAAAKPAGEAKAEAFPDKEESYRISTDLVEAVLTNKGGELASLKLKKHLDKGQPVEMILKGAEGSYFFGMAFGPSGTPRSTELMNARRIDDRTIEFWRSYYAVGADGSAVPFTLRKRFGFRPGEYMLEFQVEIENSAEAPPALGDGKYAYTLYLGPQLGPKFAKLGNYDETRKYYTFANGKRSGVTIKPKSQKTINDRVMWSAVVGKYFSMIAIPGSISLNNPYAVVYNTNPVEGLQSVSQMSLSRPQLSLRKEKDSFRFYIGPNLSSELSRYNDPKKNSFGDSDLKLNQVVDANPLFGWLEWLLKKSLILFHMLIPNWGVAIILVTLLVKAVFFPLTLKSSISMAKMADIQPKMAELQAKYKEKPEKLNQEMAEFYKREGINPLSGCLPILIQLPIFFAMYSLFNTHFDLRSAMFIPGWIPDLSRPDTVLDFATVDLVLWKVSALRILPIVYVVSQLLYGKFTQTTQPSSGQNAMQMKLMMYGMPIFFFFVLYDAPSGLLVYWIASNILTIVQQMITNRIIHQRKQKQRS